MRIIWAMIDVACESRTEPIPVSRVISRARVSTRTFYELFDDRSDCLLAAIEKALELAGERAQAGYEEHTRWVDRVRQGLLELLRFFDEEPRLAWLIVVQSAAAGPAAIKLRAQVLDRLAQLLDDGRADLKAQPPTVTAEAVVGGVLSVIHTRLLKPGSSPLVELLNPLMSMIVLPYVGSAAARRELARPHPAPGANSHKRAPLRMALGFDVRLTTRTLAVLEVIAAHPGLSNKEIAEQAGIVDQGQASRLLARLCKQGLLENTGGGQPNGLANAWQLTPQGERFERAVTRGASSRRR